MTVNRMFTVALALLASAAIVQAVFSGWHSLRDYKNIAFVRSLAEVKTAAMDATVAMSLERSVVQVALALDDPIPSAFRDVVDGQRKLGEDGIRMAVDTLGDIEVFENRNAFQSQLRQYLDRIALIRREVDALLAKPLSARDAQRAYELPFELKTQITGLKNVVDLLHADVGVGSSAAVVYETIQSRAWEGREYGGRARTYFAIATLRQAPLRVQDAMVIKMDAERADGAWDSLSKAASAITLPAALQSGVKAIEDRYYGVYKPTILRIQEISAKTPAGGAPDYGVSFESFFDLSNAGLDAFAKLSSTAGQTLNAYWAEREANAFRGLVLSVIVALGVGALAIGAIVVMRARLICKLEAMTAALSRVANGDLNVRVERSANDLVEVADLADAVSTFRDRQAAARVVEEEAQAEAALSAQHAAMRARLQSQLSDVVTTAVSGDFSARIEADFDEAVLNELAHGVNTLLETVNDGVGATARVMERIAAGDLNERMDGAFQGAFADLQGNVNQTVDRLSSLVGQISATAGAVRGGADDITSGASELASRAEQQASSLEETATTMDQMSASIKSNAESSSNANALANEASQRAQEGGAITSNAVAAMREIEESATKIADIIGVIDAIAFQTNLLALNAAVEAARAGEAGKGFAVVAQEVRALAQRSSDAANDIRGIIDVSAGQVADGVRLVSETGESLQGIVDSIAQVETAIKSIAGASKQQASGIEEISSAVRHMDQMTQQNSSMAEKSASNAKDLSEGAQQLQRLIAFFKLDGAQQAAALSTPKDAARETPKKTPKESWGERKADANGRAVASTQRPALVASGSWAEF